MPEIEVTDEWCKRAATLHHSGVKKVDIAKELGCSAGIMKKVFNDPRCIDAMMQLTEAAHQEVAEMYKNNLTELMHAAIIRLKEELRPGSKQGMEAVKTVLKSAGILDGDANGMQETHFSIVMPNTTEQVIEISKVEE